MDQYGIEQTVYNMVEVCIFLQRCIILFPDRARRTTPLCTDEIRWSEIASEAILGQKQSIASNLCLSMYAFSKAS